MGELRRPWWNGVTDDQKVGAGPFGIHNLALVAALRARILWLEGIQDADTGLLERGLKESIAQSARIRELERRIESMDCRYVGRFAEISGSHCPLDEPCDRCQAERKLASYESYLDRIALSGVEPYSTIASEALNS